jgi:cyclin-dependent kinase 1
MCSIKKKTKLGEGSYGIVYEAEMENGDGNKQKVAVKRNYGDEENKGISCIKELSFLASLSHPCVTKLKTISVGDPFEKECPMTPLPKRNQMKEDSHHFILEYADHCLEDYYYEQDNYSFMKIIIVQTMLGIEYLHGKKILHRDLKPGNILISIENSLPYAKICDFGLSCNPNNYRPSTPGTVTAWYRAPEICCEYDNYSFPSDIWSLGCIFYEIMTKIPLIKTEKDSSSTVFKKIIEIIPQKFSINFINKFITNGDCSRFKHNYTKKRNSSKVSFSELLRKNIDEKKFNESKGNLIDFSDLLEKILVLEPEKRLTAKEILNHTFFDSFKSYIDEMRIKYPPIPTKPEEIKILDCLERRWAVNILIRIYNRRDNLDWYNDHIVFHSLRIYDEYLSYCYSNDQIEKRNIAEKGIGKLHTEEENSINFYTCIYMVYKYYSSLYHLHTWDKIFPKHICTESNISKIENFEKMMLKDVLKYVIFRPTLLEFMSDDYEEKDQRFKNLDIRKFFMNYCNLRMDYFGTMKDLYLQIKKA